MPSTGQRCFVGIDAYPPPFPAGEGRPPNSETSTTWDNLLAVISAARLFQQGYRFGGDAWPMSLVSTIPSHVFRCHFSTASPDQDDRCLFNPAWCCPAVVNVVGVCCSSSTPKVIEATSERLVDGPYYGFIDPLPGASSTSSACCFRMNELMCVGATGTACWLSEVSTLDGKPKACPPLDVASWSLGRSTPCQERVNDMAKP